jgi:hypothetical protein
MMKNKQDLLLLGILLIISWLGYSLLAGDIVVYLSKNYIVWCLLGENKQFVWAEGRRR